MLTGGYRFESIDVRAAEVLAIPKTHIWRANFNWLIEGLAVGGSYPIEIAERLAMDHGFKAVIDMRAEDCDDAEVLARHGMDLLHLPTFDLCAVDDEMLDEGVDFARKYLARGAPVLIHCEHGIGRAALMGLCVLVDQGHEPLGALQLAKDGRPQLSPNVEQYHAWARWLNKRGQQPPHFDAFAAIAYRHLPTRQADAGL